MSNIKVKVIDKTTLEILEDAKAGDRIDLSEVQMIDTDFINALISKETNNIVKERLEEQSKRYKIDLDAQIVKSSKDKEIALKDYELKHQVELDSLKERYESTIKGLEKRIIDLNSEAEKVKATNDANNELKINNEVSKLKETFNNEVLKYQKEINELKSINEKNEEFTKNKVYEEVDKLKTIFNKELSDKEKELNDLKTKLDYELKLKDSDIDKQKFELEKQFSEKMTSLKEENMKISSELDNLKLSKAHQNVKQLGEELEHWCNEEFEAAKLCGFEHCSWNKDNEVVKDEFDSSDKGSKADYIFKMYINDEFIPINEITSVCLEMKNESPDSVNKKTNEFYYKKLDINRKKKNCEYALLVSELDWTDNDAPIKKVAEYEKMYMVRPPYMITFLSIVYSLGKRYRDLILSVKENDEELKEMIEINEEFENFKVTYVEKPINALNNQLASMRKNASSIISAANSINNEIDSITSKTITNILSKIETFTIKKDKLVKKINKLQK